jgi:3-oxoacyl-[acyl-carrier protein] reductase
MDLKIAGRRALVLGGNRGIGLAIAKALAAEGVVVTIAGRDAAISARAAEGITGCRAVRVDLGELANLPAFASEVGDIDILVNNTGGPPYGGASGRSMADWQQSFNAMALAIFELTDLFLPAMRRGGWGRILTVVSSGAVQPVPVLGISNTLRAGLIAWSKTLSSEIAADGITANILMPGRIDTDRVRLTDAATADREGLPVETVQKRSWAQIPLGRYGTPEELAAVAAFACSERASYLTGSVLRVDGGIVRHV